MALLLGAVVGFAIGSSSGGDASASDSVTPSVSPSPVHLVKIGGVLLPKRDDQLTPEMEPYPYTEPGPPREATQIAGRCGRPAHRTAIPMPALSPYRVSPGLTTLILYEGRYFMHHQTSGFKALGHFTIDGDQIRVFNDPNCSSMSGAYTWKLGHGSLTFEVIDDPCASAASAPTISW